MRILSNHLLFRISVRGEVVQQAQDDRGVLRSYPIEKELILEFSRNSITAFDIECGMRHFMKGSGREATDPFSQEAWGAHPDTRDGVAGGHVYRAWDPRLQFSIFDTESLSGKDKDDAEAFFNEHPVSTDWVVVTAIALKPPWPSYDSMQWKRVGTMAHELGLAGEALSYELATKNREAVVKALQEEHAKAVAEAEEDANLKVIVP